MNRTQILVFLLAVLVPGMAGAQHSAYSGQEARQIKALSDDEIGQYRAGAGMGYARAAELNHYPGPMHVLELADKLSLTSEQRADTLRLMEVHRAEARAIGVKLVEAERELDRLFASGKADQSALAAGVKAAAELRSEYRLSHLETHRRMRAILSVDQVQHYDRRRGYTGGQKTEGQRPAQKHKH